MANRRCCCTLSLSKLLLVASFVAVAAARPTLRRRTEAAASSLPPRLPGSVKDIVSPDALYHDLSHAHSEHIPQEEGSTQWFSRRANVVSGRPLASVEYVLETVKRFERRHARLHKAPGAARRRHLLATSSPTPKLAGVDPNATRLFGELDVDSLYWAELKLGTPATQVATVQIDSGSDLLWIQCSQCGRSCQPTKVIPYRPSLSSTAAFPACSECPALNRTLCPVGQCSIQCRPSGLSTPSQACQSVYGYGDSSQVLFNVQMEVVTFPQQGGSALATSIIFGCDIGETSGLITNPKVNGLMGLGRSNLSIPSQLFSAGVIKHNAFSVCLGGFEGGGALLFGNDTRPPKDMVYTSMGKGTGDTLYNATMTGVAVGNITLDLPPAAFYNASNDRPDAIFDTGSDLIGLPGILYNAVFEALNQSIVLPRIPFATVVDAGSPPAPPTPPPSSGEVPASFVTSLGLPTCYQVDSAVASSGQPYDASQDFPQLTFTFGNASLVLHPDDYIQFIEVLDSRNSSRTQPVYSIYACPFILNTFGGITLLGDYAMRNHYFTFDRTRELIGFAALNCSTYQSRSPSARIPL